MLKAKTGKTIAKSSNEQTANLASAGVLCKQIIKAKGSILLLKTTVCKTGAKT